MLKFSTYMVPTCICLCLVLTTELWESMVCLIYYRIDCSSRTGYKVDKLRRNVRNKHRWRATVESHLTFMCECNPWQLRDATVARAERRRHPLFFGIPDMRSMTCNNARVPRPRCSRTYIAGKLHYIWILLFSYGIFPTQLNNTSCTRIAWLYNASLS